MASLQELQAELTSDPLGRGYAAITDQQVADDLNTFSRDVTQGSLSGSAIFNAIVPSEFVALTDQNRQLVRDVFSLGDAVDVGPGTNARTVLLSAFGNGTATRDNLVAAVTKSVILFAGTTLHEVKLARGTCPAVPVTVTDGYAVITTTAATETHNPRLLADNTRTGERVRVESFRGVSAAGSYDTKVPPEWRNAALYADDAYGVM